MSDFESGLATQVRFLPGEQTRRSGHLHGGPVEGSRDGYCARGGAHDALDTLAERDRGGWATLGASVPVEEPLPEPEGEREQVWREGFGWVDRPAEIEAPAERVAA